MHPGEVPIGERLIGGDAARSTARGVRARAREALLREITDTARRRLAEHGAARLSLRAVARDLGMVSSAVYRYVPSRDALLTLLIVEAYEALGAAAEKAEATVARGDLVGRFAATASGIRRWALRHPHEYALIFGSPVPGYAAPADTVGPATRAPRVLIGILLDAAEAFGSTPGPIPGPPPGVVAAIAPVRAHFPAVVPDALVVRGLMGWTYLIGAVSSELFGHRHDVIGSSETDRKAFFDEEMSLIADFVGLPPSPR
jgi:AcrR family transcriptional regulator